MTDKTIEYCPLCGGDLETDDRGITQSHECTDCETQMRMEVWGHTPDFWHRE